MGKFISFLDCRHFINSIETPDENSLSQIYYMQNLLSGHMWYFKLYLINTEGHFQNKMSILNKTCDKMIIYQKMKYSIRYFLNYIFSELSKSI